MLVKSKLQFLTLETTKWVHFNFFDYKNFRDLYMDYFESLCLNKVNSYSISVNLTLNLKNSTIPFYYFIY